MCSLCNNLATIIRLLIKGEGRLVPPEHTLVEDLRHSLKRLPRGVVAGIIESPGPQDCEVQFLHDLHNLSAQHVEHHCKPCNASVSLSCGI